ncbi:MAG: protein kinase domain-containing protein [Spirulinaceae cyanobacterium]
MTVATDNEYKYVLDDFIGRGTFSQTQKAEIAGLRKAVIVKTLGCYLQDNPEYPQFKQHFQELAAHLAKIDHPNLAAVVELFEEDNFPFIIYEAIAGENLAQILETSGKLPEDQALEYIQQIADAVASLHQANLLHLDIQPRHIIRRQGSENLVLIEFGLTSQLNNGIRQTHANLLSPGYAAPEQHDFNGTCTAATDIYSLSATLYALLTGSPPPPAPIRSEIKEQEWLKWPDSVSNSVKTAILQGIALDSQQRPQTIDAWKTLLTAPEVEPEIVTLEAIAEEPKDAIAPEFPPQPQPTAPEVPVIPNNPKPPKTARSLVKPSNTTPKTLQSPTFRPTRLSRLDDFPVTNLKKTQRDPTPKIPVGALITTCLVAASAGVGFGFSIRFNRPDEAGSTLWHLKQSFPPREVESNED